MTEDLHVFVCGTLKPGAANFDRYCGNKVVSSHRAYIYGELYDLPLSGYPGAIHGNVECMPPVQDIQENTTDRSVVSRCKEKLLSAGARRFCFRCQKFRF